MSGDVGQQILPAILTDAGTELSHDLRSLLDEGGGLGNHVLIGE